MDRPDINAYPVANAYAAADERIIEFSFGNGAGGLISFRSLRRGGHVEVYRTDPEVVVTGPIIPASPLDVFMEMVKEEMRRMIVFAEASGALSGEESESALLEIVLQIAAERFYPHERYDETLRNLRHFI